MKSLQDYLNCLWAGVIEKHTVDLFNHSIEFEVKVFRESRENNHHLKFLGVKGIYYINNRPPFEPEDDDYLELTSVTYDKDKAMEVKVNSGSKEYNYLNSKANFLLEIWDREVYIKASSVEIDGKLFEVGVD